jgi:5'(3')-deoxyribonucleotidase
MYLWDMKKRVYIDMDGTLCDFMAKWDEFKELYPKVPYPHSINGFFSELEPMKDGIEIFMELSEKYDVHILTRPSIYNLNCYTEKALWVRRNLGFEWLERLIFAPKKELLKGDYLIDDYDWPDFEGEQLKFGSDKFPDWESVRRYLL